MIFQHFNLLNSKNVADNIAFPLQISGWKKRDIKKRVDELLEIVGLSDKKLNYPEQLSGGQKQRLSIARALVGKPEILILDDSSSALDYATDLALRKGINALEYKPTVFIVSQRTSSIMQADKIVVLDDGVLVGLGKHENLLKSCEVYIEIYNSQYK